MILKASQIQPPIKYHHVNLRRNLLGKNDEKNNDIKEVKVTIAG